MKKLFVFFGLLPLFAAHSQTPAPGPYYFVTDNVGGNPQFYCGDPDKGTYAGIFTMENYNLLAHILGDIPPSPGSLKLGQSLVPPETFSFKSGSVTIQPFAYTFIGSQKKINLPIGPKLNAFLSNPLYGAKFDLTLPFTNDKVGLSPSSAHLRIDDQPNGVHTSIDFSLADDGIFNVVAAGDGIILGNSMSGEGPTVIKHTASNGREFLTIYQHLEPSTKTNRAINSSIKRGDFIGKIKNKGDKTHLHFSVAVRGESKTINGVLVPALWYLIDPLGIYDYRRDPYNPATYNYTFNYNMLLPVRGVHKAFVFVNNPLAFSYPVEGELSIGESKTVTISANKTHNLTGIYMRSGQTFQFTTASPEWNNGNKETDCNGYDGTVLDALRRHPDLKVMALTGELFHQNNALLYTGHYFRIGCGPRTHTVPKSGYFVAFANDMLAAYGDNSRVVTLTIKRTQ